VDGAINQKKSNQVPVPDGKEWSECFSKLVGGIEGSSGSAKWAIEKNSWRVTESPMNTIRLDLRHLFTSLEVYLCIMQPVWMLESGNIH